MNKPWKWIIFAAACLCIVINLLQADFSAYAQLSLSELLPILVITGVVFLVKTGIFSGILIALKRLWDWIKNKI